MTDTAVPTWGLRHRLALALDYANLKPGDMAVELDVHRNTIGNYLSGHTTPSRATLRVWALRCGVPFEWLRSGDIALDTSGYPAFLLGSAA